MEKKVYELKIDPEFEELVAKPSEAEQAVLCESLDKYGCLDELTVWHGFILDGHTRYRRCKEKGIPFSYRELEFESKEEAKLWILELSLGRRSLTKYQRTKIALQYEAVWKAEADRRKKAGVKVDLPPLGAEGLKGDTRDRVAKLAGVGHNYVDRVRRLEAEADEETKKMLEKDEIAVGAAIKKLPKKEKTAEDTEVTCITEDTKKKNTTRTEEETGQKLISVKEEEAENNPSLQDYYGFNGKRHTGSPYPDVPESYSMVEEELDRLLDNYITNMTACLERYTKGIQTPENRKQFQKLVRDTHKDINTMMKEAFENE